jgi:hypothetical protein
MEGLALSAKIAKVVGGGKLADDLELIHLRLSRIGLAALLAAAVGSDDADARAVTAKKPLGEIHGILITAGGNATLDRVGCSLAGKSLTAPATILAPGGHLTLADGTDLPRNVFSTMWAFHGSLASSSSWLLVAPGNRRRQARGSKSHFCNVIGGVCQRGPPSPRDF